MEAGSLRLNIGASLLIEFMFFQDTNLNATKTIYMVTFDARETEQPKIKNSESSRDTHRAPITNGRTLPVRSCKIALSKVALAKVEGVSEPGSTSRSLHL